MSKAYFFSSVADVPGLFDRFFAGMYLIVRVPLVFQLCLVGGYALTLFFAATTKSRRGQLFTAGLAFFCLILTALLLFQPWDELFVNLRHSHHWSVNGNFSFNLDEAIEGTVDFLPYFFIGVLERAGFPPLETLFFLCALGGWSCILFGRRLLLHLGYQVQNWAYPILLLYPPLLLNGSHLFSVPLFTAAILWSAYDLFFEPKAWRGWFFLSLVPLIRVEGAWWVVLCLGALFWQCAKPKRLSIALRGTLALLPFLALSLYRLRTFGSAIPVPVQYKSTLGNTYYSLMGLGSLVTDLVATFTIVALLALAIRYRQKESPLAKPILLVAGLLTLFVLPYYSSGGDWFPSAWGRYLFPLSFFLFVITVGILIEWTKEGAVRKITAVTLAFLVCLGVPFGSGARVVEDLFYFRRLLARLTPKRQGREVYRIQALSQLGTHLKNTTEPTDRIASSEVATIMYFADRPALDLLGVANPEIAKRPLRATPALVRRTPRQTELPHRIFKRLYPELIAREMPEYIYTFDFFPTEMLTEIPTDEMGVKDMKVAFERWARRFTPLHDPLYAGLENLVRLGYTPIIVRYGFDYFNCYWVSSAAKARHLEKLNAIGMKEESFSFTLLRGLESLQNREEESGSAKKPD